VIARAESAREVERTLAAGSMAVLFVCMGSLAWLATTGDGASYLNWLMAIAAAGVPLAVVFGVLAYRSVVLPLERTRQAIDRVSAGELLFTIHADDEAKLAAAEKRLREAVGWSDAPVKSLPLFYGVVE
jgi:aerotaxis receptor